MKRRGLLVAGALSLILAMAVACGGDDDGAPAATRAPTATSLPAATATATSPPPATATPTSPPPATATPITAAPVDTGAVARGRELYLNVPDNAAPQALWCFQCHLIQGVEGAAGLIGPEHTRVAADAVGRIAGMSAEEYIRDSIKNPEAFVAEGIDRSTPGLMTNAITEKLTDEQIDALVAFLLTQK